MPVWDTWGDVVSEGVRRHLDSNAPLPMRMMAAKGMAPLPPLDMVLVVCGLSQDADSKIAEAALATLAGFPEKILGPALEGKLPPDVLDRIAKVLGDREVLLQKLVLNRLTRDDTIAFIASSVPASVAELIANNQERCIRSEAIVRAIAKNQTILKSSLDRLFDFLVRAGVIFEEMAEFAEAIGRLSPVEMQETAARIELPMEVQKLVDTTPVAPSNTPTETAAETVDQTADTEDAAEKKMSIQQLIGTLNVAQKVALAMRGNREARTLLIRENNRVVATAAIRSPRITEQEVIAAAQSRSVCDDVIRIIASSKDMTRPYGVKTALVNNPKTPLPTAMRFLTLLRQSDLNAVAKSKNVSSAVAAQAKRLMLAKTTGGH